jgi:hypothetical protein
MQSFAAASFRPLQMGSWRDIVEKYRSTFIAPGITPGITTQPVATPMQAPAAPAPTLLGLPRTPVLIGTGVLIAGALAYAFMYQR